MSSFLTLVLISITALPSFAEQIALVLGKSDYCSSELCVHGKFQKGQTVTILSSGSEKTCIATTGASFTAEDEMLKFPATKLENLKGCKEIEKPFMAVFSTKVKYTVPKSKALPADKLAGIDKKIKESKAFREAYEKAEIDNYEISNHGAYPRYNFAELKKLNPAGMRYELKDGKLFDIVWHKIGGKASAEGAMFGVYLDSISPVSELFKNGEPYVFLINDQIHVFSNKTCQLGCGENTNQVYQFNDNGFTKIYSNSDFST